MNLQYPRYHCIIPMFLLVDNSDSPSIVEQSQQGCDSNCNSLLTIIPSSVMYPMPYACQLAFSNVGISCSVPQWMLSLSLLCVFARRLIWWAFSCWVLQPLLFRVFSLAPWDSLSDYVHPGIACLVFWASNWAGALWIWFVIGYLCLASIQEWPSLNWLWLVTTVTAWMDNIFVWFLHAG